MTKFTEVVRAASATLVGVFFFELTHLRPYGRADQSYPAKDDPLGKARDR